ncbi:mechanosensitive ion channel domain-containing protein [Opitutus sp. GAS368]|jgi:MscS family membrane protein|uniref:mechanosensitive ion channel family protein n=1 Tax=Opitutus sp. GAS368 TaxID=1882749 RepID=UPI00087AC1F4|nr:mechanosensitive ion channel domain-containing protein [Opitutus sp. GAS368]SDS03994.1 MscS family membrane protein [Opitutus sp. GAS368]
MKFRLLITSALWLVSALFLRAQEPAPAAAQHDANTTAAAAATATAHVPAAPGFLRHMVDTVLEQFDVRTSENTVTHYAIAAVFLIGALLLRRVVTNIIFGYLRRLTAKTETTLDDRLLPVLETPVATFIMLTGIFSALRVLKLSETTDQYLASAATVAFSLNLFWALLNVLDALVDHAHEIARARQMGVAAFMPWIKKTLVAVFVVFGVLLTVQSLGYNVSTILQGLGLGGLAFALAAQDTIANLFGSIVVAIDQPFKLGETVRIVTYTGTVEDIGLRSTKIRLVDKSLVILPNKLVSSEAIVNLSRFAARRVEQVLNLTYDTTPAQMEAIVGEIRALILAEPEVDAASVQVYFRDLAASSLDIWLVYVAKNADFEKHMALRQRLNLAFMRAVAARGLSFAFPTSVMHLDGPIAKQLAGGKG